MKTKRFNSIYKFLFLFLSLSIGVKAQNIDIQGHRGARGIMPENTIPAFLYALDQGVTTLELDVVVSKDDQIVVSHEPWLSHEICLDPTGNAISNTQEKQLNIYEMTYAEIAGYDCGSKGNVRFADQTKMKTEKPLLVDAIKAAERHVKGVTLYEVNYNIEIKSTPEGDGVFHPGYKEFSDLVFNLIDQYLPWERVIIQSFDFRVLKYWNEQYPDVKLAVLIENMKSPKTNLQELGFTPEIYSPYFKLLSKSKVIEIKKIGMQVIPWTVNDKEDMQKLISWKVDGLITDYPNRCRDL